MLGAIQAMCDRIRRKSVALARPAPKGNVSKRIDLLDEMQCQLSSLLAENPSWPRHDVLIRLFDAEMLEARQHYEARRYRSARRCRGSAMASLICLKRNIASARRDSEVQLITN